MKERKKAAVRPKAQPPHFVPLPSVGAGTIQDSLATFDRVVDEENQIRCASFEVLLPRARETSEC